MRVKHNGVTENIPANYFEEIILIQFGAQLDPFSGSIDIIGLGSGEGESWAGYVLLMNDSDYVCVNLWLTSCFDSSCGDDFAMTNVDSDIIPS